MQNPFPFYKNEPHLQFSKALGWESFIATLQTSRQTPPEKRIGFKMEALLGREGTASSRTLHFFGFRLVNSQPNALYNVLFLSHKRARHHVIAGRSAKMTRRTACTTTRRRKNSGELLSRHASF